MSLFRAQLFTPQMKEDLRVFMREFADRYFKTVRDALQKADPNHLYLGSRFAGHTLEEVQACAEYCDVICVFRSMWAPDSIRSGHQFLFDVGSNSVVMWAALFDSP